jgi:HD-GYP domain-containing protein (c-di-GMP phosphodiesterase class II)
VLACVATVSCRLADVEEAVILLGGRDSLTPVARHGRTRASAVSAWSADQSPLAEALESGLPAAGPPAGRRRTAAAPLMVDGRAQGVLVVRTSSPMRRFDRAQLDILGDLAAVAAGALTERALRAKAEAALDAGVAVLARAVDIRDDYTGQHSAEVGKLARRVGERLGMEEGEAELLEFAARLHDVGKLGVPDAILQKPGPLEEDEWAIMRRHPEWGADMVSSVPGLESLADLVRSHHERWDGGGYPAGLAGERIPLASRVISACDAFSAMVSRRPYREPFSVDAALAELATSAGTQFDPQVVEAVQREAERS